MIRRVTRHQIVALAVFTWVGAAACAVVPWHIFAEAKIAVLVAFAVAAFLVLGRANGPLAMTLATTVAAALSLTVVGFPAIPVIVSGALAYIAFEISVMLIGWPATIPVVGTAEVEHLRAVGGRLTLGVLAALIVTLLGLINLPSATLLIAVGSLAAGLMFWLVTRRTL